MNVLEMLKNRKQIMEVMKELTKEPVITTDPKQRVQVTLDMKRNQISKIEILQNDAGQDQIIEGIRLATNEAFATATKKMAKIGMGMNL